MKHIWINDKIRLEKIEPSMAQVIFDTIDRDRQYLREWLPFIDFTVNVSDTVSYIRSISEQKEKGREEIYSIWYQESFAGLIGLKDIDWINYKAEIGYWLAQPMQGRGIMTLCVSTLIKYATHKLRMNRILIKVATGNLRSEVIPVKLGFVFEGIEREGELLHGKYHNLKIFSWLRSDLKAYSEPGK